MNDSELQMQIGRKIREIRKKKKISQMELAYSVGMSMNTISYIELGKIATKLDTINKIANYLEVDFRELFGFDSFMENKNHDLLSRIIKKLEKLSNEQLIKIEKILDIL